MALTQDVPAEAPQSHHTAPVTPVEAMLELYDVALAGCLAADVRETSTALIELIAALDFNYDEIAGGLYRLYDHALREVKAERFEMPAKILRELRDAWRVALAATPTLGADDPNDRAHPESAPLS